MPTPNPPKTTHLTPLISLDLLFPPHIFLDSISLSLFLWLGIQLHFTTSMSMPLFTASQIHYHQCETKMKRSQIGVRRRISRLLCVKSTSFSFFFPVRYLISGQNPIYIPVWPKLVRYNWYLNDTKHHCFCTSVRTSTKYTGHTYWYGTKLSSLIIGIICTYLIKIIRWDMI